MDAPVVLASRISMPHVNIFLSDGVFVFGARVPLEASGMQPCRYRGLKPKLDKCLKAQMFLKIFTAPVGDGKSFKHGDHKVNY